MKNAIYCVNLKEFDKQNQCATSTAIRTHVHTHPRTQLNSCTGWLYIETGPRCHHFLTHWGRVTHICVSKLTIIGSDNGLSPGRRQAIIWTNDGILLIRTFRTHFSEIVSEIHTSSFKKMHFKMSSGKWRPSCLGLNVLKDTLYCCDPFQVRYKHLHFSVRFHEEGTNYFIIIAEDFLYLTMIKQARTTHSVNEHLRKTLLTLATD